MLRRAERDRSNYPLRRNPRPAALDGRLAYNRGVTSKEKLRLLVDSLPDEQADELLRLATDLYATPEPHPPLPAFVGMGASGRSDVSERADEFLDGFGR